LGGPANQDVVIKKG